MSSYVVGIDISSSKVCGVVGKIEKDDNVQIVGITTSRCNGIRDGIVVDTNATVFAVSEVKKSLENIVGIPIESAYLSIPISLCELTRNIGKTNIASQDGIVKISDVKEAIEIAKLLPLESHKEVVSIEPEKFIVDGMSNICNPLGMKGNTLQVDAQVVISQTSIIEGYKKCLTKAGIETNGIVVNSLGIYKDILDEEELDNGVVLVDVGADVIEVSAYKSNKILNVFSVALGGNTITNDISICLKVPHEDAESLKVKCSNLIKDSSLHNYRIRINSITGKGAIDINYDTLVEIIGERVKELLSIIKKKLIQDGNYKDVNTFVIVGGGISQFRDITLVASAIFEKPVRIGSPSYVGAANPIYSTATGIIKQVIYWNKLTSEESLNSQSADNNMDKAYGNKEKSGFTTKLKKIFAEFF